MLNTAIIDLRAIKSNARAIRKRLPEKTKFCAVVKADAYGHGAPVVASALYPLVDCFAVALVEEGIELRLSGIDKDILVLNKFFRADTERAVFYGLTLTVCSVSDLSVINREAEKQKKTVRAHVKYNTGMNRLGADGLTELTKMFSYASRHKRVSIEGLYSHLANPDDKKSLNLAINKFLLAIKLAKGYNNTITAHISASGGFLKGEFFDMVRIGILLYGYKPFRDDGISVKKAMRVYAPIIKRRELARGEAALYGKLKTTRRADISIIRYGYADGLSRRRIKGQFNNRCMDATAVVGVSKSARRYAVMKDAEKLAEEYGTISYEVLTRASLRAQKKYIF